MPEEYMKEYSEVEDFLIEKLKALPRGGLAELARTANLDKHELSRFRNRQLKTTRSIFLKKILEAFGYKNVEIKSAIYYKFSDNQD